MNGTELDNTKASRSVDQQQACSACRFWRQEGRDKRIGVCVDAVERARKAVPFAINLQASLVFGHGGKDCPCFEPNDQTQQPHRE